VVGEGFGDGVGDGVGVSKTLKKSNFLCGKGTSIEDY
jgi:hypothetical protein